MLGPGDGRGRSSAARSAASRTRSPRQHPSSEWPAEAWISAFSGVIGEVSVEERRPLLLLLVMPALAMVLALSVYPLLYSLVSAFTAKNGAFGFDNFIKTFDLYGTDILFTMVIVTVS